MAKKATVRCVDMCIYIDENVYKEDHNVELIFDYLTHLFYVLACKKKMFATNADYEGYSIYAASHVYMRLTNPKQFLPEDDKRRICKVKSILNYIKKVLYPLKVDYQKETFNEVYKSNTPGAVDASDDIKSDLMKDVCGMTNEFLKIDMINYFKSLPGLIKSIIQETPYGNQKKEFHNLYISCLITLLRSVTLSNENKCRLQDKSTGKLKLNAEDMLENVYYEENLNSPVVWSLKPEYETLVAVLSNKIRYKITSDIRDLLHLHEPSEEIITDILMSPLSELNEDNND